MQIWVWILVRILVVGYVWHGDECWQFTPICICEVRIVPFLKSHNASDEYPTLYHFCTRVHITVTKRCIVGYEIGALRDLYNRYIVYTGGFMLLLMMTSSNETFSALLAICAGNSPVPGESPAQRPVARSFDVYFDLRLNKRLIKQSWGWWFETLPRPLWRHSNVSILLFTYLPN